MVQRSKRRFRVDCVQAFVVLIGVWVLAGALLQPAQAEEQTVIHVWHVWSGARLPILEEVIADFEALHPDIKVEHRLLPGQSGMAERYMVAIAGGSPPDVIMTHGAREFPSFASQGLLLNLDPFIEADGLDTFIFLQSEYEAFVWDGTTYGLPQTVGGGSYIMYYDKDHFAQAGLDTERGPETWTELEQYTRKLTIQRSDGTFERIGFSPYAMGAPFKEWLYLNNGYLISDDGRRVLFNSPEALEALTWMVDSVDYLYPTVVTDFSIGGNAHDQFFEGTVSMHVSGVWHVTQIQDAVPEKNYGAWVMPYNDRNPEARLRNIAQPAWGYAIPYNAPNPEAAWKFLKYVTAGEGNRKFMLAQLRPSPVIEYNFDLMFYGVHPFWDVVMKTLQYSERAVVLEPQNDINQIINQMTALAARREMSPRTALDWAAEQVQVILDNYWASKEQEASGR